MSAAVAFCVSWGGRCPTNHQTITSRDHGDGHPNTPKTTATDMAHGPREAAHASRYYDTGVDCCRRLHVFVNTRNMRPGVDY